ncbi:MAG: hypothetical protein LBR70_06185 [Lactobacillaceae bacterium]|jgi:hypothetical protein|nr:hypothetical protein [Lactobacillaceae bacterium]
MDNKNNLSKLQLRLCELKLEERRLNLEMKNLVNQNKTVDFFQAKQLSSSRQGVKTKIKSVESKIIPNIIA